MADKPILFSTPMARALNAGRKTQTRRSLYVEREWRGASAPNAVADRRYSPPFPRTPQHYWTLSRAANVAVGDRLWVREAWFTWGVFDDLKPSALTGKEGISFEADRARPDEPRPGRLRPGMFMPRWASRITLTVTGVRAQRLQEISEVDAIAEGVEPLFAAEDRIHDADLDLHPMLFANYLWHGNIGQGITEAQCSSWTWQFSGYKLARDSYSSLWERINGAGAWDANPWAAAYSFDVERRNIDREASRCPTS
jgi:hypothetical protein